MKAKNVHVVNNMGKKVAWIIIGILSVLVIGAIFVFGLSKPKKIEIFIYYNNIFNKQSYNLGVPKYSHNISQY